MPRLLLLALLLSPSVARASEATGVLTEPIAVETRNYVNLRVGASSANSHPELCLEVAPVAFLAVEACGTGAGLLHQSADPEISHYRLKWSFLDFDLASARFAVLAAAGFAELQIASDAPGFRFADAGPDGVETAGPELGAGLRALVPLGAGFELVGELHASLAYFAAAPELVIPRAELQPVFALTLGAGF